MTQADLAAAVRALTDRAEILDCLARYTRGMDRHDRALARSAYHDDAIDEHGGYVGGIEGFLDWAFAYHSTQASHQHYLSNTSFEIEDDTAHVESYYLFVATDKHDTDRNDAAPLTCVGGRYVDRFERRDGRWAIAARVTVVEWRSALPATLPTGAVEALSSIGIRCAQDSTDSSYARPLVVQRSAMS